MKLRIFLAEDNSGDILLVKRSLEQYKIDHELQVVRDGAKALALVERMGPSGGIPCPNLVLLDLNLPKVDGSDILAALRRHPECADTPVVVITSSDADKDRARMSELGIDYYFKKPSSYDAFMELGALIKELTGEGTGCPGKH